MNHLVFKVFVSENAPVEWKEVLEDFQTELISHALFLTAGDNAKAARLLKMKRTTFVERKRALGIVWED